MRYKIVGGGVFLSLSVCENLCQCNRHSLKKTKDPPDDDGDADGKASFEMTTCGQVIGAACELVWPDRCSIVVTHKHIRATNFV